MRIVSSAWAFVVALLIVNPAGAADNKKVGGNDPGIPYFKTIDRNLKPVTLTEDQKPKLEALKKDYEPKFKGAYAKRDVLTSDPVVHKRNSSFAAVV
ncbi:MAG: hypothetical protein ABSG53_06575 [Thermoguttaceae bacterium]|jgi:hypothetical protein